ncbi:glycosyltransferase [Salegentibacter maritimus]|uniref:glycosyltransferase n=1 Tax=Salegentibacter maritimus TaxID=2794347 RepID=UPI0018E4CA38|nr:glycosyltransferase [Salegentibacter maritimus]MBI6117340.1 glycosyltransferase [Salegentibacter maritimus]
MNKIKVLYIIDTLEGYGAEKSLVEITSNFTRITPIFVHIYQGDMLKPRLEEAGVRVYSLDLTKKYAFNLAVKKLKVIYLQEQPEIVHATLFRSEIIARKLKKAFPQIFLVGSFVSNAYSPERFRKKDALDRLKLSYFRNLDKRSSSSVDHFISNSYTIKDRTSRALGIDANKVSVIYRGRKSVDFNSQKVQGKLPYLNSQNQILLNVSRLIPLKGQLDLLKAMPQVIKVYPQIQLVFAGHGSFREYLERYARKLEVKDNIRFLGRIDNIPKLLVRSDIFLYPSYSEGLPGALIEAMMAQRIIIASNIPENLECVDENCALIYKKGNIPELVAHILRVLKNPEQYRALAENARKKAIEKFELSKVVTEYESFYLNAVSPKENSTLEQAQEKKIRILHLIQKPQNRGAETFACQLANHQKRKGNIVKLVSVFSGSANLAWKHEIESLDASPKLRFLDYKAWKKMNIIIEEFKPDIIQANAGDTLKYTVFSKKIFGWKPPIIFRNASEVGRYLKNNNQKRINSFFYQQIAGVASVSKASKKDLIAHFPFLKSKTEVIPVGLERTSINTSFSFPQNQKNIIHVGGFSFEKNHQGLIRIFKGVLREDENVILHLVGDGPLRDSIEKEVLKQDLQDKIKFYGFVENALPMIAKADVLVLPSIIEGLPGVLLEAMYCETPVIANNVGGINEIVNADTGILIERDHEDEFSKAILQVLNENNSAQIQKARDLVLKNYMNESLVWEFEALYKKII